MAHATNELPWHWWWTSSFCGRIEYLEQFNTCSMHQHLIYFVSVPLIMKSSSVVQSWGLWTSSVFRVVIFLDHSFNTIISTLCDYFHWIRVRWHGWWVDCHSPSLAQFTLSLVKLSFWCQRVLLYALTKCLCLVKINFYAFCALFYMFILVFFQFFEPNRHFTLQINSGVCLCSFPVHHKHWHPAV
jgi:hypothetical protein